MLKKSFCLDWARIFHDAGRTYSGFKASFFVVKDTLVLLSAFVVQSPSYIRFRHKKPIPDLIAEEDID